MLEWCREYCTCKDPENCPKSRIMLTSAKTVQLQNELNAKFQVTTDDQPTKILDLLPVISGIIEEIKNSGK